ncbi:zinc finger BED domain-containing protein 1-like isoform X1 [Gadus morhua]|uniref:zinc finger BED domain-containing protein 1-like isoform X1 n=4 Tax=Gadus morhua TaxID=8049 RepID=UPI0011B4FB63|nr:zinc finger BED domain-containing protein 1-like isoform X1 [Gadus morhua]
MDRKRRSKVWLHFNLKKDGFAQCNTCNKLITAKGGCTTNMIKHLRLLHGITINECSVFDALRRSRAPVASSTLDSQPSASNSSLETESVVERSQSDANVNVSQSEPAAAAAAAAATLTGPRPQPAKIQQTPFSMAARGKLSAEQIAECHRKVTAYVVKGLHPFSDVESPTFRDMIHSINPKYTPPTRECLTNRLIPAWYKIEKSNLISELSEVSHIALTCDGWTSLTQEHYLTVTVHYLVESNMRQKVLATKAVYRAQTGIVVAEEIGDILKEFGVFDKVVAVTVDNAANMDVAIKRLQFVKLGCFAHSLNLAAQSLYSSSSVAQWTAKIRAIIVWMKRSSMAKVVLREKQDVLNLPQHSLILDVRTRWNSLYLMMERFLEQYPAIQAASLDQRLRKNMERDRLDRLTDGDFTKAEDFIRLMQVLYTCTLCVSTEKSPTAGQILPIIQKLEKHFAAVNGDTAFVADLKKRVWGNISTRYKNEDIRFFLEEATALDPRFKNKMDNNTAVWERIKGKLLANSEESVAVNHDHSEEVGVMQGEGNQEGVKTESEEEEENQPPPSKQSKKSPLEELFAEEDAMKRTSQEGLMSMESRAEREIQTYLETPPIITSSDPAAWFWTQTQTYPLLSCLAFSYLCVQASSTPSERVISTAGNTICAERSRLLPEKADMIIFLNKNCC